MNLNELKIVTDDRHTNLDINNVVLKNFEFDIAEVYFRNLEELEERWK